MDECGSVHELIDLHSINERIQILNERSEQSTSGLYEPRENAYITVDLMDLMEVKNVVNNAIEKLGQVRTTTTCPGHCILNVSESNGNFFKNELINCHFVFNYQSIFRRKFGDSSFSK